MKLRIDLPLLAAAWIHQADGFYTKNDGMSTLDVERFLNSQTQGTNNMANGDGRSSGSSSGPVMYHSVGDSSGDNGDQEEEEKELYPAPPSWNGPQGGVHSMAGGMLDPNVSAESQRKGQRGRSGKGNSNNEDGIIEENPISTPQVAINDAHENDIMILSADYMYVSNCLLRKRHATDPVRQRAFELFKQTAAGDWFIVFGYVCGDDWSCWKKNVQNLLSKKGEEYGGGVIGRCVSRLVREKAEGLRTRRRRHVEAGTGRLRKERSTLRRGTRLVGDV